VKIDEDEYSDEDVYSVLLADMVEAVQHNRDINTTRANCLQFAATFFALAIVLVAIPSQFIRHEQSKAAATAEKNP
jgi:hypothetical protein